MKALLGFVLLIAFLAACSEEGCSVEINGQRQTFRIISKEVLR